MNCIQLNDVELYELCMAYGAQALHARAKFGGLLPEVFRRRLYLKKGFTSIFEFAAKLAGMSEEQVRRVLNLEKKFETMPVLKSLLINGQVSISKLARVASIATPQNEEFLADNLKVLPNRAIETLVRDEKSVHVHTNASQNSKYASAHILKLSCEVEGKLLELQKKGIDINALILELLQLRELQIAQEKEKIAAKIKPTASRYIPAEVRDVLRKEYGEKCAIDLCEKTAVAIHHTQRFSIGKSHNPKFLAPLCREHHLVAHSVDRKFLQKLHLTPTPPFLPKSPPAPL